MLRVRWFILACTLGLGGGSVCATLGYAWYLHSSYRHRAIVAAIDDALGMPLTVEHLAAAGRRSTAFAGLDIAAVAGGPAWLVSPRGVWHRTADQAVLTLEGADIVLAERGWSPVHAARVGAALEGCARCWPDLSRVELHDLTVHWGSGERVVRLGAFDGTAVRSATGVELAGRAQTWNARACPGGIELSLAWSNGAAPDVELTCTDLPVVDLPVAVGRGALTSGRFTGRLERSAGRWSLAGVVQELDLIDWRPGIAGRGERLDLSAEIDDGGRVSAATISGRLDDVDLTAVWWAVGTPSAGGCATVRIDRASWRGGRFDALAVSADIIDIDAGTVAGAWGLPEIEGRVTLIIDDLQLVDDTLSTFDCTVHVEPPVADRALIDRDWIMMLAQWLPAVEVDHLPAGLLEFDALTARLVGTPVGVRLFGGGADGRTALSLRLLGRRVPVVRLPRDGVVVPVAWSDIRAAVHEIIHMDVVEGPAGGYAHMTFQTQPDEAIMPSAADTDRARPLPHESIEETQADARGPRRAGAGRFGGR